MTKTSIDIDDKALDFAQQVLHTTTKKDKINAALAEVAALLLRDIASDGAARA